VSYSQPENAVNQQPLKTKIESEEIFYGIWKYKNVFTKEMDIVNRLESSILESNGLYNWQEAMVGDKEKVKSYRDCVDFKIKKLDIPNKDEHQLKYDQIWQDCYDAQKIAVDDYSKKYNIKLDYWEATNFIRYGQDQHFQEHADHGWSYVATTSLVGYLNDDYEGGELYFGRFGLNIKPEAGDLYVFPSSYIYSHRAMPVKSGVKYSAVTMLDYNDWTHTPDFYNLINGL
jgi:hypothetical protein